jgi:hypothetical protein
MAHFARFTCLEIWDSFHVCSKCLAQVGGFFPSLLYIYCLYILLHGIYTCLILWFLRLKINHVTGYNDCAFIRVVGVDASGCLLTLPSRSCSAKIIVFPSQDMPIFTPITPIAFNLTPLLHMFHPAFHELSDPDQTQKVK